jgi:hypothetical protein
MNVAGAGFSAPKGPAEAGPGRKADQFSRTEISFETPGSSIVTP